MVDFASLFKAFLEKYGLKSIIAIFLTGLIYFFLGVNNILELIFIFAGFVLLVCIFDNLFKLVFRQLKRYKENYYYNGIEKRIIDELFYVMSEKAKSNALKLMDLSIVPNTKYHLLINDKTKQYLNKNDFNFNDYYINTPLHKGPCIDKEQIGDHFVIYVHPHLYKLLKREKKNRIKNKNFSVITR